MKNLNYKQLLSFVDDVLNNRWDGDTSKPIMIWFWNNVDLDTVKRQLQKKRELANFDEHPIRHSTYMILDDKTVRVADYPEYAKRFCLPSSFHDFTKGFLYHRYFQQLDPEYIYDCMELIHNIPLPLIGLVNDYEKKACEKKGITVDMDSFVNYRYIGKTMQDWMEEATAVDKYGLPKLPPCITDFATDNQIKDLFFYRDEEPNPIEEDKRPFAPDSWNDVWDALWQSYVDYHEDLFTSKYSNTVDFLNGEYGLCLPAEATREDIYARIDTIPDGLTRKLARELASWFFDFGFKKSSQNVQNVAYSDIEEFLLSRHAENEICMQPAMKFCEGFYNRWIEWLKARR